MFYSKKIEIPALRYVSSQETVNNNEEDEITHFSPSSVTNENIPECKSTTAKTNSNKHINEQALSASITKPEIPISSTDAIEKTTPTPENSAKSGLSFSKPFKFTELDSETLESTF